MLILVIGHVKSKESYTFLTKWGEKEELIWTLKSGREKMQIVCNKFVRYIISNKDKLIKSSVDIADGVGRDMNDMLYNHL